MAEPEEISQWVDSISALVVDQPDALPAAVQALPLDAKQSVLDDSLLEVVYSDLPDAATKATTEALVGLGANPYNTDALEAATENHLDFTVHYLLSVGSDFDSDRIEHIERALLIAAASTDPGDRDLREYIRSYLPSDSLAHYDADELIEKMRGLRT